ncbi:hypothetical protein L917_14277 [Plasmopara halstedii]|uniref:PX domain-containing protein n=1 Tax=Plasmopara halstedii TaxID=4781 RepID=A0A0P1B786_PLAHL|nr:hypothetical protein L917_14277 [Plasmopara halstedii]CEG49702.1 hypothetical protein L917_14277 [Plasmopara halstedii]|eukprot:XP_024586071.1 hypothetical protein L917_14277 [Plasmopara halstedii]
MNGRRCISSRKSTVFDNDVSDAHVPLAIKYLEQVSFKMSVTKKHTDVRYLMRVRHHDHNVIWSLKRSFDEYRKLRLRLLRKLQHGHFCNANCPWLYGFLKSYFPKKRVFIFSSAHMIERRKRMLERFFAVLYEFLTDHKNFGCSIIMTVFAHEVVEFIYGDALQQHGLIHIDRSPFEPLDRTTLRLSESFNFENDAEESSQNIRCIRRDVDRQLGTQLSLTMSLGESMLDDDNLDDEQCKICGLMLSGIAGEDLTSTTILQDDSKRFVHSMESLDSNGQANFKVNCRINSSGGSYRSSSARRRRRAVVYYLTTLSCGHQFHDECIVPKLNELFECPTCGCKPSND